MRDSESLAVVWRPIGDVRPYPGNPRKISEFAIDKVAASIKEFGWQQPIVVDTDNVIVVGHTRLLAARKLDLKLIPVHVATGLTPEQIRAYRLADNRTHEEADWDFPALGIELSALKSLNFDVNLTGFTDADFARAYSAEEAGAGPITSKDIADSWQEMPEYQNGDERSFRRIVVHFADQGAVDAFAKLIGQDAEITPKTRFVWFPAQADRQRADKCYAADPGKGAGK
jgi:hypothetical protein